MSEETRTIEVEYVAPVRAVDVPIQRVKNYSPLHRILIQFTLLGLLYFGRESPRTRAMIRDYFEKEGINGGGKL